VPPDKIAGVTPGLTRGRNDKILGRNDGFRSWSGYFFTVPYLIAQPYYLQ